MGRTGRRLAGLLGLTALAAASGLAEADDHHPSEAPPADLAEPVAGAHDVTELSLEDLLTIETDVASKRGDPLREAPGVVTVLTREDIRRTGARDLLEVLMTVPGFSAPGVDVQGAVGVGFRGVWGHEGKLLLLIDGLEMNEDLYSTLQFGNHYPIEHVERIEIIRGPGSAVYGGHAELAVINIVTRGGEALGGGSAEIVYGQRADGLGRATLSLEYGQALPDGGAFSVAMFAGQASRSGRRYTDVYGGSYDLEDASRLDPSYVNLGLRWRGLSVRAIYDDYVIETRDGFDAVLAAGVREHLRTFTASVDYGVSPIAGLTVTPRLVFKRSTPYQVSALDSELFYDKTSQRLTAAVAASYDVREGLDALVGVELDLDQARLNRTDEAGLQAPFGGDQLKVTYTNVAGYAQVLYDNPIANLAVGARVERHSDFGSSFVPRAAVTRVLGQVHLKALASRAFRAPGIENISLFVPNAGDPGQREIKPERTTAFELEVGWAVHPNLNVAANLFDITIDDPIVYGVDEVLGEGYTNFAMTGSRGGELEIKERHGRGTAALTYSYYHEAGKNEVASYAVPADGALLLGMPAHKLTLSEDLNLPGGVRLHAGALWLSDRWAITGVDEADAAVYENLGDSLLVDGYASVRDRGVKGLELGLGVRNLLADRFAAAEPYDGFHAPYPMFDRELFVRLGFERPLD